MASITSWKGARVGVCSYQVTLAGHDIDVEEETKVSRPCCQLGKPKGKANLASASCGQEEKWRQPGHGLASKQGKQKWPAGLGSRHAGGQKKKRKQAWGGLRPKRIREGGADHAKEKEGKQAFPVGFVARLRRKAEMALRGLLLHSRREENSRPRQLGVGPRG